MKSKDLWYVEGFGGWFVVRVRTARQAKKVGVAEFGRGNVQRVHPATQNEIHAFLDAKGGKVECFEP